MTLVIIKSYFNNYYKNYDLDFYSLKIKFLIEILEH